MSAAISTERLQKLRTTLARETAKGDFANKVNRGSQCTRAISHCLNNTRQSSAL